MENKETIDTYQSHEFYHQSFHPDCSTCFSENKLSQEQRTENEKILNKVCYWCGNTDMTWYNTGEGGEGEFAPCSNHAYNENGELSIYAQEAIKKYPKTL